MPSREELPFSPWVGCLLALGIGLALAMLVFQIARLAYFGEIRFGGPTLAPNRMWMIRDANNAGLMVSTTRVISGSMSGTEICLETKVRPYLWRRDESIPIDGYCLCHVQQEGRWTQVGECPDEGIQ